MGIILRSNSIFDILLLERIIKDELKQHSMEYLEANSDIVQLRYDRYMTENTIVKKYKEKNIATFKEGDAAGEKIMEKHSKAIERLKDI